MQSIGDRLLRRVLPDNFHKVLHNSFSDFWRTLKLCFYHNVFQRYYKITITPKLPTPQPLCNMWAPSKNLFLSYFFKILTMGLALPPLNSFFSYTLAPPGLAEYGRVEIHAG